MADSTTALYGPVTNKDTTLDTAHVNQWFSNMPVGNSPDYVVHFNDFLLAKDYAATDWVVTTTEAGTGDATEALAADEACGALVLTNDDADNDLDALQATEENYRLTSGKKLWFETRVKVSDADEEDLFIGLAITDTTVLDATDKVGFRIEDGSASILCETTKNSATTQTDSQVDAADATYVKLGFYWDGSSKTRFYVNRELVATHTTNNPDDENLCLTVHHQNGAAAAKVCTIDYFYVCQER